MSQPKKFPRRIRRGYHPVRFSTSESEATRRDSSNVHQIFFFASQSDGAFDNAAWPNNYELTGHEPEEFSLFWKRLANARKTPFLDAAIRRFAFAGERRRAEDRIVDLIISAETLFLATLARRKSELNCASG